MAQTERPGSVTAMGILNLLIGVTGSLCCLCSLGFGGMAVYGINQAPPPPPDQPDFKAMFREVDAAFPAFKFVMVGVVVAITVIMLLLAISGVGLLKMRSWGRTLSIVAAVALLVVLIGNLGYTLAEGQAVSIKFLKQMQEMQKDMAAKNNQPPPPAFPMQDNPTMNAIQNIVTTLVECTYPIVLIWIMMLPSVRDAFAGRARKAPADDLDDRGWGDAE